MRRDRAAALVCLFAVTGLFCAFLIVTYVLSAYVHYQRVHKNFIGLGCNTAEVGAELSNVFGSSCELVAVASPPPDIVVEGPTSFNNIPNQVTGDEYLCGWNGTFRCDGDTGRDVSLTLHPDVRKTEPSWQLRRSKAAKTDMHGHVFSGSEPIVLPPYEDRLSLVIGSSIVQTKNKGSLSFFQSIFSCSSASLCGLGSNSRSIGSLFGCVGRSFHFMPLTSGKVGVKESDPDQGHRARCLNPYWCLSELAIAMSLAAFGVGLFVLGGVADRFRWSVFCWLGCCGCLATGWKITHLALAYRCWFG